MHAHITEKTSPSPLIHELLYTEIYPDLSIWHEISNPVLEGLAQDLVAFYKCSQDLKMD